MTFNKVSRASNNILQVHAHLSIKGNAFLISCSSVEKLFHKDLCQKSMQSTEETFSKKQHLKLGTDCPPASKKVIIKNF